MENIHPCWFPLFKELDIDLNSIYSGEDEIYPTRTQIFRVFEMDVFDIKIVLLGQDPYYKTGQANGLSFSVNNEMPIPPTLKNIYKEIQAEFPERHYVFKNGNLDKWFYREKIFLLNAALSVVKNRAGSHMKLWSKFTNRVIQFISEQNKQCIFVLLGNFAKTKTKFIQSKENIIECVHPSPNSAFQGFFGSRLFLRIEETLGYTIDWSN
jgi:uracil-DNA glycosylase